MAIDAGEISLDDGSFSAETRRGDEGNITLSNADNLILFNNSEITTNATEQATGGDININADAIALDNDSRIVARAVEGQGGNISLTSEGIFTEEGSIIDASSQLGIDGNVTFNTPDADPTSGLVELSDVPIDVSRLLEQNLCEAGIGVIEGQSSFINIGRGGMPLSPFEALDNDKIFVDVDLPKTWQAKPTSNSSPQPIVEATAWTVNRAGKVELVSQIPQQKAQCNY